MPRTAAQHRACSPPCLTKQATAKAFATRSSASRFSRKFPVADTFTRMEVSGGEPDNSRKSSFFTTNGTRHSVLQQVAHRKFRRRSLDAPGPDNIARYGFAELFGSHVRSASRSRDLVCKLLCKVPCGRRGEWCPYDRHLRARTRLRWSVMAARSCRLDRARRLPCLAARAGRCTCLRTHPASWSQRIGPCLEPATAASSSAFARAPRKRMPPPASSAEHQQRPHPPRPVACRARLRAGSSDAWAMRGRLVADSPASASRAQATRLSLSLGATTCDKARAECRSGLQDVGAGTTAARSQSKSAIAHLRTQCRRRPPRARQRSAVHPNSNRRCS